MVIVEPDRRGDPVSRHPVRLAARALGFAGRGHRLRSRLLCGAQSRASKATYFSCVECLLRVRLRADPKPAAADAQSRSGKPVRAHGTWVLKNSREVLTRDQLGSLLHALRREHAALGDQDAQRRRRGSSSPASTRGSSASSGVQHGDRARGARARDGLAAQVLGFLAALGLVLVVALPGARPRSCPSGRAAAARRTARGPSIAQSPSLPGRSPSAVCMTSWSSGLGPCSVISGRCAWMKSESGPERPPRHIGSEAETIEQPLGQLGRGPGAASAASSAAARACPGGARPCSRVRRSRRARRRPPRAPRRARRRSSSRSGATGRARRCATRYSPRTQLA